MGKIRRLTTVLGASSLVLGSLTVAVTAVASPAGATSQFKACVVTDTGGINDKSFNYSAWQGALNAANSNVNVIPAYLSSNSSSDYQPNINQFEQDGCGLIVTVGYLMGDDTHTAATNSPSQQFAIVDQPSQDANVLGLQYRTDQGAFLGGYLAAASSKTGKVATYGGLNIPPVTIYMNGFVAGVRYYNKVNHTHVKVLGWAPQAGATCSFSSCAGTGSFTNDFSDQTKGKTITTGFFAAGADIVFPVAGSVGKGSVAAARQAGRGHSVMWVDTNGCVSDAGDCSWFIGSVTKGIAASVHDAIVSAANGNFVGGNYTGTLKNKGTDLLYGGISVPASLKAKIAQVKAGIIAGHISVNPNNYSAN
jgi:basic membrane protein A